MVKMKPVYKQGALEAEPINIKRGIFQGGDNTISFFAMLFKYSVCLVETFRKLDILLSA